MQSFQPAPTSEEPPASITIYVVYMEAEEEPHKAAFSSQENAEAFIENNEIEGAKVQEITFLQKKNSAPPEYIYLTFLNRDDGTSAFIKTYLSKFDAQEAIRGRGFIRSLKLDPDTAMSVEKQVEAARERSRKTKPGFKPTWQKQAEEKSRRLLMMNAMKLKVLAVGFVIFLIIATVNFTASTDPETNFAENQSSVAWLPKGCTDVSYYLSDEFRVFECTTDAQGFRAICKQENLLVADIADNPISVKTYRFYVQVNIEIPSDVTNRTAYWNQIAKPTIEKGLRVTRHQDTKTTKAVGAFDEVSKRAYFWIRKV